MQARYKKIRDLLGDKRGAVFAVPEYQRGYEWQKKHWRDLWTDINRIGDQVNQHYLGNIILLKKNAGRTYEIVDGQQRIVTISILAMALRDVGEFNIGEDGRLNDVRMKDILEVNRGGTPETKLKLADEEAKEAFDRLWARDIEEANGQVRNAYDYYVSEIRGLTQNETDDLLNDICDYLKVVETKASDSSLAYAIFQSQNERGKDVSPQILAKARIHGEAEEISDPERATEITRKWDYTYDLLENKLGGPRFQQRLRIRRPMTQILINSTVPTPRQIEKSELYRYFEKVLENYNSVFDFVQWFKKQVNIYLQLASGSYEVDGHNIPDDAIRHLQYLNSASTHSEALSLAIYNNIEKDILLIENFKLASIMTMRMRLSSMSSADMREAIYRTSAEIRQTSDENEIRETLRDAVREYTPTDGEIEEYLKANGMNVLGSWRFRTTLALVSIEEERHGPWRMELDNLHVEHIAPRRTYEKPEYREWRERLNDDRFEQQKNLIGNLTLLLDEDHASVNERSFASKKRTYDESDVKIAEEVARYGTWASEDIEVRTRELTTELIERWSL